MENRPNPVLRWHVARFHAERAAARHAGTDQRQAWLEVVVAPSSAEFPDDLRDGLAPLGTRADRLEWWVSEEDALLHGWVLEEDIQRALEQTSRVGEGAELLPVERRITEDMVFLQCAFNPADLAECWEQASQQDALPDLTSLVSLSDRWCDFTKPARRMAKQIYSQALKDPEAETEANSGGPDAAK